LRKNTGVLICNKLYVYHDVNKNDDEQTKVEIEFTQDNPDGAKFIELFDKSAFSESTVKEFVCEKIKSAINVEHIKNKISSDLIGELLRTHFVNKYSIAEFEQAIAEFDITVMPKAIATTNIEQLLVSISKPIPQGQENSKLNRTDALSICRSNGVIIGGNYSVSNRTQHGSHFANDIPVSNLTQNWWLLLVDHRKRELHVFKIGANEVSENEMYVINNKHKQHTVKLNILCDDDTFTDKLRKKQFKRWLVKTIKY